jgi:hypothetical protein
MQARMCRCCDVGMKLPDMSLFSYGTMLRGVMMLDRLALRRGGTKLFGRRPVEADLWGVVVPSEEKWTLREDLR